MQILTTTALSKNFGKIKALDDLSLTVNEGQVMGILGPNGSGKTTFLATVLGILHASSGSFEWFEGMDPVKARLKIGTLLETPNFYPFLNAYDNLKIIQHIKQIKSEPLDDHLKLVGLYERRMSKFRTYSLGMKQRLAIAATLIGQPEVLIFDEPTNGLDPMGIVEVRDTLKEISSTGKTIIMASHILHEVEKICTDVAILRKGKLLGSGKTGHILSDNMVIEIGSDQSEALRSAIESITELKITGEIKGILQLAAEENYDVTKLNQQLSEKGIYLNHLVARKKKLEEEFISLVSENNG